MATIMPSSTKIIAVSIPSLVLTARVSSRLMNATIMRATGAR